MTERWTLGLDLGSTYTKAVLLSADGLVVATYYEPTGSRLADVSTRLREKAEEEAVKRSARIGYVMATGYGRHQVPFRDMQVTDLTACAHGSRFLYPGTKTVLDIGGQTMKASRLDEQTRVSTFRLNDKCASGTGAFLEKTARYMGYATKDIGPLLSLAKERVPISGVCAVFAESEVISHLSDGVPPEDIMYGAALSLTDRSLQLLRRVKGQAQYTLVGGILRWKILARAIAKSLGGDVNIPGDPMAQFVGALGSAVLGRRMLVKGATAAAPQVEVGE